MVPTTRSTTETLFSRFDPVPTALCVRRGSGPVLLHTADHRFGPPKTAEPHTIRAPGWVDEEASE